MKKQKILFDCREFNPYRRTGISRFLEGLISALIEANSTLKIFLATFDPKFVPSSLIPHKNIEVMRIRRGFFSSEYAMRSLTRQGFSLFISPYPKIPIFSKSCCKAINTIHDVFYISLPIYRKNFKTFFDRIRLRAALNCAATTWYVSSWSLKETEKLVGHSGTNPKIRYNGIENRFFKKITEQQNISKEKYKLEGDYILVLGNGRPHKNIGVLLEISKQIDKTIVFAGVSKAQQNYWLSRPQKVGHKWIEHIPDDDLPALIRESFCLAHPSTAEGFGFPPLEAMASGVPAVVSSIPVLIETTGGNALTADPHEPNSWITAFQALENKNLYRAQVEKGTKWAERLRSGKAWGKHIADIENVLR